MIKITSRINTDNRGFSEKQIPSQQKSRLGIYEYKSLCIRVFYILQLEFITNGQLEHVGVAVLAIMPFFNCNAIFLSKTLENSFICIIFAIA